MLGVNLLLTLMENLVCLLMMIGTSRKKSICTQMLQGSLDIGLYLVQRGSMEHGKT